MFRSVLTDSRDSNSQCKYHRYADKNHAPNRQVQPHLVIEPHVIKDENDPFHKKYQDKEYSGKSCPFWRLDQTRSSHLLGKNLVGIHPNVIIKGLPVSELLRFCNHISHCKPYKIKLL